MAASLCHAPATAKQAASLCHAPATAKHSPRRKSYPFVMENSDGEMSEIGTKQTIWADPLNVRSCVESSHQKFDFRFSPNNVRFRG
jgi:hypothetical protein